jgi:nitroreductase
MSDKRASTSHPIHDLLAARWSPYAFDDRSVSDADLRSLFEAARWAPSSYNEQPWSYIVATREDGEDFAKLLSCLVDANQVWAKAAPVLALGVVRLRFVRNDKPNHAAVHDLGLAAGNLLVEATARGLSVHQMIGIVPERARDLYQIPDGSEAWTALAIGHRGDPSKLPETLRGRDTTPRQRKPLREFVFGGGWGTASRIVS